MRRAAARAGVFLALLALAACGKERDRYEAPGGDWQRLHHDPAIRTLQQFIQAHPDSSGRAGGIDRSRPDWRDHLPPPPHLEFTPDTTYRWCLETNRGAIHFHLLPGIAPQRVANLMYLTLLGFYDGLPFFRGVKGKMMVCGCPRGNGRGDPGYDMSEEITKSSTHDYRGTLGFLPGHPAQFYITFKPWHMLDGKYTVVGEMSKGQDVLTALEDALADQDGPPRELIMVETAYIYVQ